MSRHRTVLIGISVALLGMACSQPPTADRAESVSRPRMPGPIDGRPSLQDVFELDSVGSPAIDPAGGRIAYVRHTNDIDAPSSELRLWSGDADETLAGPDGFPGSPQWAPDGRHLVSIGRRGGGTDIRFLDVVTGSTATVRRLELTGVRRLALSPDSRWAALTVGEPAPPSGAVEQELIGPFDEEDVPALNAHLWLVDLEDEAAEPRRLTDGDFTVYDLAWSPTGDALAVVTGPAAERNNAWRRDIALLDVPEGTLTPWVTETGPDTGPTWSPDGSRLAFSTTLDEGLTNAARELAWVPRPEAEAGTPELTVLTDRFDTSPNPVVWTSGGLVFSSEVGTGSGLFLVDPDTVDGRDGATIERLTPADIVIDAVGPAAPGATALAVTASATDGMTEVYRLALDDSGLTRVTDVSSQVAGWSLGSRDTIQWAADDGVVIEGVLHRPAGASTGERRPLVVTVHGGPRAASTETIAGALGPSTYPTLHWLWRGAYVLEPNYRGSSGYGTAFRRLHGGGIGTGDAGDVLAGIRHLVAEGLVDPDRVGVMGWSYGGFISAWLSATTTEIAAASVGAGITDWGTHYGWESGNFTTRDFSFAGPPWERADAYVRASPLTYIGGASVPTLVQHVEDDPIVPLAGARRFYRALLEQGVPTRMIVYPGRTHGIPQARQRLGAAWHNWQWFARYLWDEEVELPIGR